MLICKFDIDQLICILNIYAPVLHNITHVQFYILILLNTNTCFKIFKPYEMSIQEMEQFSELDDKSYHKMLGVEFFFD